jgi:hypothetical protein
MAKRVIFYLFFSILIAILFDSCMRDDNESLSVPDSKIVLRWSQAYTDEDQAKIETGLKWGFSFLGAALPVNSSSTYYTWKSSSLIEVDIETLGFTANAINALQKIISVLKKSEEYKKMGGIDVGRFVMLIFNAPEHYYAITGVRKHIDLFKENYSFHSDRAAIIESCVSKTHRLISLPHSNEIVKTAYMATEGAGSLLNGTFTSGNFEVFDIMPNGQLRFAVYNESGDLIPGVDTTYTHSGKPAKCLWCHEINIEQPFYAVTSVDGYIKPEHFKDSVLTRLNTLKQFRNSLTSDLDYNLAWQHTLFELLYISFTEPSAERLSNEWQLPISEVKKILSGLQTHIHPEFSYLGNLYHRSDIEQYAPYPIIPVSSSARELSLYEPNFLN